MRNEFIITTDDEVQRDVLARITHTGQKNGNKKKYRVQKNQDSGQRHPAQHLWHSKEVFTVSGDGEDDEAEEPTKGEGNVSNRNR